LITAEPEVIRFFIISPDEGPKEFDFIYVNDVLQFFFLSHTVFAISPGMYTNMIFDMMSTKLRAFKMYQKELQYMNLHLDTITVLRSDHICSLIGIYINPNTEENKPYFSIYEYGFDNGFRIENTLCCTEHHGMVLTLLSVQERFRMLSFGTDSNIKTWAIVESELGPKHLGKLTCLDNWYLKDRHVTCAKLTRGGKFVVAGTYQGHVMLLRYMTKTVYRTFQMRFPLPVHDVCVSVRGSDESSILAIGEMVTSIERFDLSKKQNNHLFGEFNWDDRKYTKKYVKKYDIFASTLISKRDTVLVSELRYFEKKPYDLRNLKFEYL
jgi:hypothetical protein